MSMKKLIRDYYSLYSDLFRLLQERNVEVAPRRRGRTSEPVCPGQEPPPSGDIRQLRRRIRALARGAQSKGIPIPQEEISRELKLSRLERDVLALLLLNKVEQKRDCQEGYEILKVLVGHSVNALFSRNVLDPQAKLHRVGIVLSEGIEEDADPLERRFEISREVVPYLLGEYRQSVLTDGVTFSPNAPGSKLFPRLLGEGNCRIGEGGGLRGNGILEVRRPRFGLEQVVLPDSHREQIEESLFQARGLKRVLEKWRAGDIFPYGKGTILLFYGPPGTGKTMAAEAVARQMGQKLGTCRFEQLTNFYYGNTEKNIVKMFRQARKDNVTLLLDECDALLTRRRSETRSAGQTENRVVNIFLQEIERYQGLVIMTTNLEINLDPALERRISLRLRFPLPDSELRARLWKKHLPPGAPVEGELDFHALAEKFPLSGGEIKNAMLRAIRRSAHKRAPISQAVLEGSAEAELKSRLDESKNRKIGFFN